ncbi:MAG: FAD-binding protein [Oscillatoriales cyanobacterium]|nr:MAG: FAD-binding protein [Oscillatoriales cyanobacterium]
MTNSSTDSVFTIVIGAGLAGLAAARELQAAGRSVVVLEKSRGPGGRLNTRRHLETRADRGVPYWQNQGPLTQAWRAELSGHCDLRPWPNKLHHLTAQGITPESIADRWTIPTGLSSAAKVWAAGLSIARNHRAIALTAPQSPGDPWQIRCDCPQANRPADFQEDWLAAAIVLAIPAAQAADLLEPIAPDWAGLARGVAYDPCFTITAAYAKKLVWPTLGSADWQAIAPELSTDWRWLAREDSKTDGASQPVIVLHSQPAFADHWWNHPDLEAAGRSLLARAAADTGIALTEPDWLQVHRWRYAIVWQGVEATCWVDQTQAIAVAGDWFNNADPRQSLEAALRSGQAAAQSLLGSR